MKVSSFLSLLLTLTLLFPAAPAFCRLVGQDLEEALDFFNCRIRADIKLLGGPGCQFRCLSRESACVETSEDNEVCGKLRIRAGFYASGRIIAEFCVIPDGGFFKRRFGRNCLTVRVCLLQGGLCGCRGVADGRRCPCRIEMVDGERTLATDCPLAGLLDLASNSSSIFPSENDFETDMSMIIEDDAMAYGMKEAYSSFLSLLGPTE